jgi:hypothetical protein
MLILPLSFILLKPNKIIKDMKRKIFIGMAGLVFVAATAITTISTINANTTEPDLMTKNIEAMTQDETFVKIPCKSGGGVCRYNVTLADGSPGGVYQIQGMVNME